MGLKMIQMSPLSNKFNELSKNTLGIDFSIPLSQRLNILMSGSTKAVDAVGNKVIDKVVNPILDAKDAHDKEVQTQEILNRPSKITQGPMTMTRNAEGLAPVVSPSPEAPAPIPQQASVIQSQPAVIEEKVKPVLDELRLRKGITHTEVRGTPTSTNQYATIGTTGDVGKYQASPKTIASWSKPWLGKKMTVEEFKNSPEAQEKFFNEFIKVKQNYSLSDEDAALLWHRGWGILGFKGTKEEKKQNLGEYLDKIRDEDISQKYLTTFKVGADAPDA